MRSRILAILAGLVLTAASAHAQFIGFVGLQTTSVKAFNNQTTTAVSATFPNIGASSHILSFCATGTTSVQLVLEGSQDLTTWFPISAPNGIPSVTATSGCAGVVGLIQAGGYYQGVRARITLLTGGTPVVNAWYSSTNGPVSVFTPALQDSLGGLIGGVGVSPTICSRGSFSSVANGATTSLASSSAATYVCDITITFGGAVTASGTVNFFYATNIACNAGLVQLGEVFAGLGNPISLGSNLGSLYQIPPGDFFCVTTTGVGTNTLVSFNISQY